MTFTTNSDDGQALAYVVTPHAYKVTPTSDARRRIEDAGKEYQRKKDIEKEAEAKKAKEVEMKKIRAEARIRDWIVLGAIRQGEIEEANKPVYPTYRGIVREVAKKHGVAVVDIESQRRNRKFVLARHEVQWRCCMETTMSLPHIGRLMGDRDHTTVMHGRNAHQARIDDGTAL